MGEILACIGSLATCLGVSVGLSACVKMILHGYAHRRTLQQNPTSDCHMKALSSPKKPRGLDGWMIHALIMIVVSYLVVSAVIIYVFLLQPAFVLQAGIGGVGAIAIFWIGYTASMRGFYVDSTTADRERGEQ